MAFPERRRGPSPGSAYIERVHRLAILLSGRGSNFVALADAVDAGKIADARIVAVVSDNPEAPGLEIARRRGLPAHAIAREDGMTRSVHEARVRRVLDAARPDLVCLAGYMRILSPELVEAYRGRIVNIHPSLLPKYPGLHVQRRALEAGDRETGCTVHYVDVGIDSGPVLLQRRVPIDPGDTEESLSARILEAEHAIYPEAVNLALAALDGPRR
jgi:formyltetrahydrofolate-dependent phosphoribosylglycinamide formyltransferase